MTAAKGVVVAMEAADEALGQDPTHSGTLAVTALTEALSEHSLIVALLGNYSRGKSTVLGGLIGRVGLLPGLPRPTTGTLTRLTHGWRNRLELSFARHRILGPFHERATEAEAETLRAIVAVAADEECCVRGFESSSDGKTDWKPLSVQDIEDRLAALQADGDTDPAPPKPIQWIRLTLAGRQPIRRTISSGQKDVGADWLGSAHRGLCLREARVTLRARALKDLTLIDTPGIDSLVLEHAQLSRSAALGCHAIMFFCDSTNFDVHPDDLRALQTLNVWTARPPDALFVVASFADEAWDRARDDEEDLVDASDTEVRDWLRRQLAKGLNRGLSGRGGRTAVSSTDVYVVNGKDLDDPRFDGHRLRRELDTLRQRGRGAAFGRSTASRLAGVARDREAELRVVASATLAPVPGLEERERAQRDADKRIAEVASLSNKLSDASDKVIARELKELRQWAADGRWDKKRVETANKRWKTQRKAVEKKLTKQLKAKLRAVSEGLAQHEERDGPRISVRQFSSSGLAMKADHIREPLTGFGHAMRAVPDFFGLNFRKKNRKEAKVRARAELERLQKQLCSASRNRIANSLTDLEGRTRRLQDGLAHARLRLAELHADREAKNELASTVTQAADTLARHVTALEQYMRGHRRHR